MKKLISLVLSVAMIVSLCSGMALVASAAGEAITAEVQGTYTTSEAAQDITIRLNVSGVTNSYCGFTIDSVTLPDGFALKSYSTSNTAQAITGGDYNAENGKLTYATSDTEDTIPADTYYTAVITAPAGAKGDYTATFNTVKVTSVYGTVDLVNEASVTANISIASAPAVDGYTAGLSASGTEVTVGNTVTVNVKVNHSEDTAFAAAEFEVEYDTTELDFVSVSNTVGGAVGVKEADGVLSFADYGADKSFGNAVYTLVFDTITDGEATVTLNSAAFSDKENAESYNLIDAAALNPNSVTVTINKAQHSVEFNPADIFYGADSVVDGASYTFYPETSTGAYYNYTLTSVTMGGVDVTANVTGDATSGWTIANVTGDLVITGSRTAKTYNVTITGEGSGSVTTSGTPTYGTPFTFTLPEGQAVNGITNGYHYAVKSVKVGGNTASYTYDDGTRTGTIAGTSVTGDIEIEIEKVTDYADTVTITLSGDDVTDVKINGTTSNSVTVVNGSEVTLTLDPETGYDYTVKVGEEDVTTTILAGEYKFNATANVTVTVTKTLDTAGVSVSKYLTLNGTNMWLVLNTTAAADGKVWTYGGNNMYWSAKYNNGNGAYCYLVVADDLTAENAKAASNIASGSVAGTVAYDMDVNQTGKVDANDAQLAYNMYQTKTYANFTKVGMDKFLEADVDGNKKVDVDDAADIINSVLGITTT